MLPGEGAIHLAIEKGNIKGIRRLFDAVQHDEEKKKELLQQRASGRFFLPLDQFNGIDVKKTNYEGNTDLLFEVTIRCEVQNSEIK